MNSKNCMKKLKIFKTLSRNSLIKLKSVRKITKMPKKNLSKLLDQKLMEVSLIYH